ncbi:hypothetical protein BD626DRAFT_498650 [Schizophyllum amplum]|uniref:SGNH hydrolase-type esterase domain-containing protein n=1 Tax=Schizophyllum amplum TaxID=97359 RepID=A0A550CBV8_9AGAR|nr:hypothetical protein BD626DRAFT_498650 [Auriculariopsis ampla]
MSNTVIQVRPSWPGLAGIKRLVVFGDSYSAVGAPVNSVRSATNPLGPPFPGPGCFTDYDETSKKSRPNWVGHFITKYAPEPRYKSGLPIEQQDPSFARDPLLVYDYARGGHSISDVLMQITDQFLRELRDCHRERPEGNGPDSAKVWTSMNALFVTWVGINDCARAATPEAREEAFKELFEAETALYAAGARNFLFIDVPHINRSPAVPLSHGDKSERYEDWNKMLLDHCQRFASVHADATVLLFSSASSLNRILDNPETFGFPPGDVREPYSTIWTDQLHPTGAVHDVFAKDVSEFLGAVAAGH